MTSVNGVTAGTAGVAPTSTPESLSSPAAVSAGAAAGSAANLRGFLDFIAAATDGASSGMRAPANPEDAEALLLLVESKLDKTVSQALGATAAARLGQAQSAAALSADRLDSAFKDLSSAQGAFTSAQAALTSDPGTLSKDQMDLQDQLEAVNAQILQQVAKMQGQDGSVQAGAGDLQSLLAAQSALKSRVATANEKLAGDDPASFAADAKQQASLQGQLDAANARVARYIAQQVAQVQAQGGSPQSDVEDLQELVGGQSALQTGLAAATGKVAGDIDAAGVDLSSIATAQTEIASGISALSRIATGLRGDLQQQADAATGASKHRDIAYDETADIAKRHRDGEVARAEQDAAKRDGDRGGALANRYLAAVADALATIQAFVAAPPPTVPQTAAAEAGGRLRLSL